MPPIKNIRDAELWIAVHDQQCKDRVASHAEWAGKLEQRVKTLEKHQVLIRVRIGTLVGLVSFVATIAANWLFKVL